MSSSCCTAADDDDDDDDDDDGGDDAREDATAMPREALELIAEHPMMMWRVTKSRWSHVEGTGSSRGI